eukprot:TRINITY_DN21781_c0_g1_i1.p1 TRINITY_DN21781_c0_g1~~TRINITY_DN21781_c0_g1_i1.p1  ORF type:complete len:738 (+),score=91.49 TRINITY_DN21781_c0_g1_i1:122-2335(+)
MFQLVSRTFVGATPSLVAIILTLLGPCAQSQGFLQGFPTAALEDQPTTAPPSSDTTEDLFPSLDDISTEQTVNEGILTFGNTPAASPSTAAPPTATPDASEASAASPANSGNDAANPGATLVPAPVAPAGFAPAPPSTGTTRAPVAPSAQLAVAAPVPETLSVAATSGATDTSITAPAQGTDASTVTTDSVAAAPADPSINSGSGLLDPASGTSSVASVADDLRDFPLCEAPSRRLDTSQEHFTPGESQRRLQGRRLPVTLLTGVDPLELVQQLVVTILIIICLIFLYRNRTQVIILLTGDDRIHTSILDCVWTGFFRCCGLCNHEWSRCLTSLPCCPTAWRGTNLVKSVASKLGIATQSIELSNLVVGDLPFYRRGSFYLAVECSQNPPMRTAVQEDKQPKTVHFPEVLTLRIRDSMLDTAVTITAYQLHVVGSNPLCTLRLSPTNIMDWALDSKPENRIKRFAMKIVDQDVEVETPPWISLEFGRPVADVRHLDGFHGNVTQTVRTATQGLDATTQLPYRDMPIVEFKNEYRLVDNGGNVVNEPEESHLGRLSCLRNLIVCVYTFLSGILILASIAWATFRYYVKNCYDKFRVMTIAKSWTPHSFPMPSCALRSIDQECTERMSGTGIDLGKNICRPTDDIIEAVCEDPPQAPPRAFQYIADDLDQPWIATQCFHDVCKFRNEVVKHDAHVFGGIAVLLFLVLCCFRPMANQCLRNEQARAKAESNTALQSRSHS